MEVSTRSVRVSPLLGAGAWLLRRAGRLVWWLVCTPPALVPLLVLAVGIVGFRELGPAPILSGVAVVAAAVVLGRWRWPVGFEARVALGWRGWCRGWSVYRRHWYPAMITAGLALSRDGADVLPGIGRVRSTRSVDRVAVRMLPGQTVDGWAAVSDRLAQTFGAQACRVRSVPHRPHQLILDLLIRDPLVGVVAPFPLADDVLTAGVPVARCEDGTIWRLHIVGHHLLIAGATGAGKSAVIWALLAGLVGVITAGLVKVWALDPKGGMELAPGAHLFDRFAHGDTSTGTGFEESFAVVLEDAVALMRARQHRLRGITRLHTPSVAEPLIIVVVDEIAALTGWVTDRVVKKRLESALALLLSQGRAVGVVVVGAVQDPRKDVLPMRDLFPTRAALRLTEADQVGLVLAHGARNRGALCDLIPDTLPGVGYVQLDGLADTIRVRFAYLSDDQIRGLGRPEQPTRPTLTVVDGDQGDGDQVEGEEAA